MGYAVSSNGLVHRDGCALLQGQPRSWPREQALKLGERMARCCADGIVATRTELEAQQSLQASNGETTLF